MLRAIKESESKVERELQELSAEQERKLEALKKELQARIDEASVKAHTERAEALKKTREQVDEKRRKILSGAKQDAEAVTLAMGQNDMESIVKRITERYLEE